MNTFVSFCRCISFVRLLRAEATSWPEGRASVGSADDYRYVSRRYIGDGGREQKGRSEHNGWAQKELDEIHDCIPDFARALGAGSEHRYGADTRESRRGSR